MLQTMKRLEFDLESKLVDANSGKIVKAEALSVPPALIGFDTNGIGNSNSFDPEYLRRLEQTVNREKERQMLPYEANAYVASNSKSAGRDQHSVWVAIQFYTI